MGNKSGDISSQQAGDHYSQEAMGQKAQHCWISHIVANKFGVNVGKGQVDVIKTGIDNKRTKSDQNPGPGPYGIMGKIKKECS